MVLLLPLLLLPFRGEVHGGVLVTPRAVAAGIAAR
jgi:hypothetical protein